MYQLLIFIILSAISTMLFAKDLTILEFISGHYNHERKYWESSDDHYRTEPTSDPEYSQLSRYDDEGESSTEIAGEGMIAVMNEPQKWGYINYKNKLIIPMQFWSPAPFVNGKATRLQKDDGEFTVYKDGRIEQTKKW